VRKKRQKTNAMRASTALAGQKSGTRIAISPGLSCPKNRPQQTTLCRAFTTHSRLQTSVSVGTCTYRPSWLSAASL
jgi:hypothetical protein